MFSGVEKLLYGRNARVSSVLCYCLQALSCVLGEESGARVTSPRVVAKSPRQVSASSDANKNTVLYLSVVTEHGADGTGKLKSCFNYLFYVIFPCDGREALH